MYSATAQNRSSSSPYFTSDNKLFNLYQGSCLDVLASLPEASVDLVFADPPYFLSNGGITCQAGKMVSVDKGKWDVSRGVEHNHEFNRTWLQLCQRVLKPNGTIFVSGTQHVIFSVGFAMQQLGFKMLNDIVWYKVNPPPNLSCRYFVHSTETILWAARDQRSRHFFAYEVMKQDNAGKQMQSLWSMVPPLKAEKQHGKHPTQKPVRLLERIVRAASIEGDVILDPFSGSATTGIAATKLNRQYIGIELDEQYLDLSIKRYQDVLAELQNPQVATSTPKRTQAKVKSPKRFQIDSLCESQI